MEIRNVSTNEVAEILNGHSSINMANVYGVKVPNAEGRAGMAAFTVENNETIDWADLSDFVSRNLPKYARPVFIRIISKLILLERLSLRKMILERRAMISISTMMRFIS